ncbi:MAG: serine/threonine protein kinase [Pseudomonadota bacterium]|nr:serine/threonine protein kinase [Pseudomonadota bacterium]
MADPPTQRPAGKGAQLGPFQAPQIGEAQRRFWLILDAMLAALVVVALIGGWAYLQVRGSLRDLRAAGMVSLLEAETRGLQLWIEEKQRDAERWASTPEMQREGAALAARGSACEAAHQRAFQNQIAPYAAGEEVVAFNLMTADGRIIASSQPDYCGRVVSEAFMRRLAPVFQGRTVFVAPLMEEERLGQFAPPSRAPLVWVEAPIRAHDGTVVAAIGFGRIAAERFAKLLALTASGTSRDAYAFDGDARILTETRYGGELAVKGVVAAGRLAPLGMAVRDPGGNLLAGHQPAAPPIDWPLTALADAALAHREALEGVLLEPYRNYRGAEVIGAWRWLVHAQLAVAVEIEADEAYGPLEYLQLAFSVLAALVLISMTAAASTSLWAMREKLREARRVGAYRIEREIGTGGMSHIYLAHHTHLKRPAAVKILKSHLATDEAVARFQREAQLCSQLAHPNTIEIYDYGTTREGQWYYAMEYLRGASLEEIVRRQGPMPAARVVHALRQACGSLKEAHDRGWVHRDVKPSNLMLCVRGGEHDVLKVLDFGLIKQVRNPDTRDITQYSRILGTPLYMAPERLRNPADADARADIYALGAVAWFALAGRPAFEAQTDHDIVYRVMNEMAPSLATGAVQGVPAALESLVARCLAKEREARPTDIEEVRRTLDDIAVALPWGEADARAWWAAHGAQLGDSPAP